MVRRLFTVVRGGVQGGFAGVSREFRGGFEVVRSGFTVVRNGSKLVRGGFAVVSKRVRGGFTVVRSEFVVVSRWPRSDLSVAKIPMSNSVISALGSNSPSPISGLHTERSSTRIRSTNVELPTFRMSCEARDKFSTASSRWYIPSNSAFTRDRHDIPYFLVGSAVTT